MSLLLWLPFVKGNCKNQGLLDVETSTLGTINYEDGKLGKAVRIGNGTAVTNGIQINTNLVEEFGDEYSCSVWVKPTGSHVHYEGAILSSGNWNNKKWAFGIGQNNTTIDPLGPGYGYTLACEISINEWTHLVSTVKNNIATVYKNGELVGTIDFGSLVLESDAVNTAIGRETYANGYFSFNGCIQDMRIYNHCLSRREIKELSKGLVLHYPLNRGGFGQDNLLPHTTPDDGLGTMTPYSGGSVSVETTHTYNGHPTIKVVPSSSNTSTGGFNDYGETVNLTSRTTYTYSCMIYSTVADTFAFNSLGHFQTYVPGGTAHNLTILFQNMEVPANKWTKVWITFTANADCMFRSFFIYFANTSQVIYVSDVKLEHGSIATSWTPSKNDPSYYDIGLSSEMVYDVSGFQNNGELVSFDIGNILTEYNLTPSNWTHIYPTCTRYVGNQNHHHFTMVKTSSFENVYMPVTVVSGQTYTFSVTYQVLDSFTPWRSDRPFAFQVLSSVPTNSDPFSNILASIPTGNTAMSTPLRGSCTFTASNTTVWLNIPGGYYKDGSSSYNKRIDFSYLRLETTEPDFIWESGSPRYSTACNIHSLDSTTNAKTGTVYIRGDCELIEPEQLTIAFWCYARPEGWNSQNGQGIFCTTNQTGDAIGSDYLTSAMNYYDSGTRFSFPSSNGIKLSNVIIQNEWHHYAFTFDGIKACEYRDGVLIYSSSYSSKQNLGSFTSIVLGFSKAGGVWRRNNNIYSDLRAYATALDNDSIQELYNTPITLSNNGVLLTQGEYVEE